MLNYLFPRIENIIEILKKDIKLIADKDQDDEWKRDHYRYIFTITAQKLFELLNTSLTEEELLPPAESTKKELIVLRKQIDEMIKA